MIVLLSCLLAKSAPAGCMQGAGISDDSKKTKRDSGQRPAGMTIMIMSRFVMPAGSWQASLRGR
jgi:hypothetical protein